MRVSPRFCAEFDDDNLLATEVLASRFHARARVATIRALLIAVPARIANRARAWTLHLPRNWPWQQAWELLLVAVSSPPRAAT